MISSNSGPKLSRLHRRHGDKTHTSRNAIQSDCLNSSLKILTESEEPNMDSFPLHRLEFKAMIPSLFGIQRGRKKTRCNKTRIVTHAHRHHSWLFTLKNLLTKYRLRATSQRKNIGQPRANWVGVYVPLALNLSYDGWAGKYLLTIVQSKPQPHLKDSSSNQQQQQSLLLNE